MIGRIPEFAGFRKANGLCRWCGVTVPPLRRTFCSADCIHQHKLRTDPGYQSRHVFERDHGVCEACGLDTEARMSEIMGQLRSAILEYAIQQRLWECWTSGGIAREVCGHADCSNRVYQAITTAIGWDRAAEHVLVANQLPRSHWRPNGNGRLRRLWEMDHRVPVVEGGGGCGLENLRTLCIWCHRHETKELARRRAEARKRQPASSRPEDRE